MKLCPICSEIFPDEAAFCPTDGRELARSTDPFLGRTLSARYRLVKRLGAGGMSVVYLARHVMIDRLSAIKILRQDLGMNPVHRERFLREARAVNRINQRNIVEITDFGETEGLVYLVMEYVAGDSLLVHIRRARFPWPRAARVALQVASALARAHQMGVIHRDLKPENILLVPGEVELVKLTDFGIAKVVDAAPLTFSEQMFGTPGYIAPEYVEGLAADGRADIYALGVVLYEMVTGKLPYESRGQADLLLAPLTSAPIPPGTRAPGLPADLEALMLRMLARRADDRPRDAFEVYETLSDILRRFGGGSMRPGMQGGETRATRDRVQEAGESERESIPTLFDVIPGRAGTEPAQPGERQTRELATSPTIEIASRWHAAIVELDASIARARKRGGKWGRAADHAAELAETARAMVGSIERASSRVAEHQGRVDRLDARGRAFRANLGGAIDALVRDRSRERAHASAVERRRAALDGSSGEMSDGTESLKPKAEAKVAHAGTSSPSLMDFAAKEALVWEAAALVTEEERARGLEEDLSFQIDALQKQLDSENEMLERELMEASGSLEGSLAALRLLSSEIVRTLDDAAAAVTDGKRA